MSENVRGPITDHVLTYACDKCREVSPTVVPQKTVRQFTKHYCNSIDIKLVFSNFEIGNMFGVKDPIPRGLRTCVVYKFFMSGL